MKEFQHQKPFLFVCHGSDCSKKRSREFDREIKQCKKNYRVIKTSCMDHCKDAPNLIVGDTHYARVSPKDLPKVLNKKAVK